MNFESPSLVHRAATYAALGDPARLRIVDLLGVGDVAPSELAQALGMASNLLAHHLKVLRDAGLVISRRSQGDGRRQYFHLANPVPPIGQLGQAGQLWSAGSVEPSLTASAPARVVFVCTANSARSHLAAALWRRASEVPATSAGTRPADGIDPGAIQVAGRHHLALPRVRPRQVADVVSQGDLIITVCDVAHEEPGLSHGLHWSIPDPVIVGTDAAFDVAYDEIERRVRALEPRLAS